jgi:hypothetical protein
VSQAVEPLFTQAQTLPEGAYAEPQGLLEAAPEEVRAHQLTPAQEAELAETIRLVDSGEMAMVDAATVRASGQALITAWAKAQAGQQDCLR